MIELRGRTKFAVVEPEPGLSILKHAIKYKVDWGHMCKKGTCAKCRCFVSEGNEYLDGITDEEWDRLEPEEFEQGYRLACQAVVKQGAQRIVAVNKPYF
ncbi:2Fe-2S iron-sulfur cluster-binding protein [Paenibacillus protaetiae]|uniref:(2Fe-2S)-binding protein n=1 Tax=Paenibacillus protaetiae TaxID=2509456 RepID=A0A4P6EU40_9BACL|nr:2Fe-2S iron-sulfur cluster-binding protein [Paenibacillus protaetiae]QAY66176.1 (2Fe-2S)-binding protein [Paenibacillus protaetiae]